jgi:hypothetical protein
VPRPCIVCSRSDRQSIDALIAAGVSDYAVGRQFGIERVSVGRHRRQHIIKPAQDRLAIVVKDADARRERQELAAAAASDTPSTEVLVEATLGLRRQVEKLAEVEGRLARMAARAEEGGSPTSVAQLAAQQFRGIETGARLARLPGFVPAPSAGQPGERRPVFSIQMVFANSGRTEEINVMEHPRPVGQETDALADAGVVDGTAVTDD